MHSSPRLSSRAAALLLAGFILGSVIAPLRPAGAIDGLETTLGNGGFEFPTVPPGEFRFQPRGTVPFWETTASDDLIEIREQGWTDDAGHEFPAHGGRQFAELNAKQRAALFQDVATAPGAKYVWSLAHRGRGSDSVPDVMELRIGAQSNPTEEAQTAHVLALPKIATMSDTNVTWGRYSGEYVVPDGQTVTRFGFLAVSEASGDPTVGNFVDSVVFSIPPDAVPPTTPTTAAPVAPVEQPGRVASGPAAAPEGTLPRTGGSPLRTGGAGVVALGAGLLALAAGRRATAKSSP